MNRKTFTIIYVAVVFLLLGVSLTWKHYNKGQTGQTVISISMFAFIIGGNIYLRKLREKENNKAGE